MPRWRRPSLLEARKTDPARTPHTNQPLSFDGGIVNAAEGYERRMIRYRVVRLLDAPDEFRSADIGQLDQGDEVQLIERSGTYWLVLCPDGRQGWLHKMTLGDVVNEGCLADRPGRLGQRRGRRRRPVRLPGGPRPRLNSVPDRTGDRLAA